MIDSKFTRFPRDYLKRKKFHNLAQSALLLSHFPHFYLNLQEDFCIHKVSGNKAYTHSHTNVLFTLLFIHQPIPTRQKDRLRTAWLSNNKTTCLNIGRVITDTIPNFSLQGFLNTLESMVGFPVSCLIHTHILRSVPCRHSAAM